MFSMILNGNETVEKIWIGKQYTLHCAIVYVFYVFTGAIALSDASDGYAMLNSSSSGFGGCKHMQSSDGVSLTELTILSIHYDSTMMSIGHTLLSICVTGRPHPCLLRGQRLYLDHLDCLLSSAPMLWRRACYWLLCRIWWPQGQLDAVWLCNHWYTVYLWQFMRCVCRFIACRESVQSLVT